MKKGEKFETVYYLFKKDRVFREKTLTSYYYLSNKEAISKKSKPIDIDGIRYKLDLETGEILNYTKSDVQNSMSASLRRTKIMLNMLLEMNDFDWFATLTFDKDKIDRTNDELVYGAYKKYINNVKHKYPKIRYITVLERHKKDNCIHFHMLIGGLTPSELGLVNSGKVCCSWAFYKDKIASREYFERTKSEHELQDTDGLPVYNVTSFPYGFTTVTRIVSRERCNSYIKKYINKDIGKSTEIFKKRFFYSRNLKKPAIVDILVGADFDRPVTLSEYLAQDPHFQNAEYPSFNDKYNIMQYWEANDVKSLIDNGIIPLSAEEKENL